MFYDERDDVFLSSIAMFLNDEKCFRFNDCFMTAYHSYCNYRSEQLSSFE